MYVHDENVQLLITYLKKEVFAEVFVPGVEGSKFFMRGYVQIGKKNINPKKMGACAPLKNVGNSLHRKC